MGGDEEATKKRRIRINVRVKEDATEKASDEVDTKTKKSTKRKRSAVAEVVDEGADGDIDATPVPKKRKKSDGQSKKRAKKGAAEVEKNEDSEKVRKQTKKIESEPSEVAGNANQNMFSVSVLKKQREELDGSFDAARRHLTSNGPWELPDGTEDKFADVALATLTKMDR